MINVQLAEIMRSSANWKLGLVLFFLALLTSSVIHFVFRPSTPYLSDDRKLNELGLILLIYENDHSGNLPKNLDELVVKKYATASQLRPNPPFDLSDKQYTFFAGGKNVASLDTNDIVAADPDPPVGLGGYVLLADGSIVFLNADSFKAAMKSLHVKIGSSGK